MKKNRIGRLLCGGMAALCLMQSLALPVWAEDAGETEPVMTEPVETVVPTETTLPVEVTEPLETTAPTEAVVETTAPTQPEETTVPTEPPATTQPTLPMETIPEDVTDPTENTVAPLTDDAILTVQQALELSEDFGMPIRVRGFVVYSDPELLILQGGAFGIAIVSTGKTVSAGQAATVRCIRTKRGLTLREITDQEAAQSPQLLETTLAQAPEHRLLQLKNLVYQDGLVSQDGTSYTLAGQLPPELGEGDTLDATAVRHGSILYLLHWQKLEPEPELEQQVWYPVPLEQLPSLEVGILTITNGQGQTLALRRAGEQGFEALPIAVENGQTHCPAENMTWKISSSRNRISFSCPQGWLSCQAGGIFLSQTPDFWEIAEGYLYHPQLGLYLVLGEGGFTAAADHQTSFAGQQVGVWSEQPVEGPEQKPERPEFPGGLRPYFGQLHMHSEIADGAHPLHQVYDSGREAGLDFLAVTDPSVSIQDSTNLAKGRKAAQQCSSAEFLALYGCEMTAFPGQKLGHISTLGINTLPDWKIHDLKTYYETLTTLPGSVSQFNHPSGFWGEFDTFGHYDQRYDNVLHLLEVADEDKAWNTDYYDMALSKGWHVAPTNNRNNHVQLFDKGIQGRTVILASELTEQALLDAIRARRVYASEDADLCLYYSVNGQSMGSVLSLAEAYTLELRVEDPTDSGSTQVEVVGNDKKVLSTHTVTEGHLSIQLPKNVDYCYLRLTQADGDRVLTAPVWMTNYEDMGIQAFTGPEEAAVDTPAQLKLTLYNQEEKPLEITEVTLNGQIVADLTLPISLPSGQTKDISLWHTCTEPGAVSVTVVVKGTVEGISKTWEKTVTIRCQESQEGDLPETVTALDQVRAGRDLETYRVRGYVTAGTDNPYNRFPDSLYLQDDTGGIQVTAFLDQDISVGMPLEIVGVRKHDGQNIVLEMLEYQVLPESSYRYVPKTMSCSAAMNAAVHGGRLLQVEGKVRQLQPTADGKGICWLEVEDIRGERGRILIEPYIKAGSTGQNSLAEKIRLGRTVRAMGLCHLDENGTCVLRVRNCEEVVYVPPLPDPSNPKTEDPAAKMLLWWKR